MTRWKLIGGLAASAALFTSACSPEPPRSRHTVPDYRADAELRRRQLTWCESDSGSTRETPDCINAREAARLEERRSLRELPPVQLPAPARSPSTADDPADTSQDNASR